ncbi:3-hydroxyisobutyrate dehydrogenase [Streptomyces morookaense]|uniref:NAD(P)-dependent oxidoreductase n=1 Tax=Streptomyces morookaense TaxID=1970 RepID=A0A7Y7B548_STRMO|nr:NAD(P)-dependent oxidoreductase [Streptomyces morookaense]GHF28073.1 3-hydroxyisobutyrate dehydrogenase [Streptomyces morookaense]
MAGKAITVIGLGAMGAGMASRLLASGFEVTVHNRTASKAEELARAGAKVAGSVREAVHGADRVLLSLSDENAVDAVLAEAEGAWHPGAHLLDTSTVSAEHSRRVTGMLADRGVHRVEACLLGNPQQAGAGELRVITAGPKHTVDGIADILDAIGRDISYLGPTGNATTTKLVFNLLLGGQLAALAEAVNYGIAAGLDRDRLLSAIGASGFSSKVLSFRADLMRRHTYHPAAFKASLMAKDLGLGTDAAQAAGVPTPVLTAAAQSFEAVVAAGSGDADAAIVLDVLGSAPDHRK